MTSPLILASSSPRRFDLLKSIGIQNIYVVPAGIDETPRKEEAPSQYVLRLAEEKASFVRGQTSPDSYILGADTIIALGRRILQKAADQEEARAQMTLLSGRRHRVYTGLCLIPPHGKPKTRLVCTRVAFKHLSSLELTAFLESRDWDGVSGYRIQGIAGAFISWINGTPSNIMGLPTYETAQLLHGNGYQIWPNVAAGIASGIISGATTTQALA